MRISHCGIATLFNWSGKNIMTWYVYIVEAKDESYYTGITTDIKKRVEKHNSKKGSKSLFGKIPVNLVYQEQAKNRSEASKREAEIKSWEREKKIKLINDPVAQR